MALLGERTERPLAIHQDRTYVPSHGPAVRTGIHAAVDSHAQSPHGEGSRPGRRHGTPPGTSGRTTKTLDVATRATEAVGRRVTGVPGASPQDAHVRKQSWWSGVEQRPSSKSSRQGSRRSWLRAGAAVTKPLSVTTVSLRDAGIGQSYVRTIAAAGGNPPYVWKRAAGSPELPRGLRVNRRTGVIWGRPIHGDRGTSNITVEVLTRERGTRRTFGTQRRRGRRSRSTSR